MVLHPRELIGKLSQPDSNTIILLADNLHISLNAF